MSRKYKSTITSIDNPIEGVYTLTIEPKAGKFRFSPGQFLHIAIDADYDGISQWPESRCFSVQTSPEEAQLKITYSVRGEFTRRMAVELNVGSQIWIKLPYGDLFEQDHSHEKAVFISGGTGITPYLSLFTDSSFSTYINPVLYAGFRDETMHVYKSELLRAKEINPGLRVNTLFQDKDSILNIEKILTENQHDASYFISGPPVMIKSFKQYLIEQGVSGVNILTDDWE